MNVLATFQNVPWKFTDVRALTVIFPCAKLENEKKIAKYFVLAIVKKPGTYID